MIKVDGFEKWDDRFSFLKLLLIFKKKRVLLK